MRPFDRTRRKAKLQRFQRYEAHRGLGTTADVDYWTSRDVRETERSHLNYVVADTKRREQSAAYHIDKHESVEAFAKNAGLGFAIPYFHNGERHDYVPDFILRLRDNLNTRLILETKGFDPLEGRSRRRPRARWVCAVNADAKHGRLGIRNPAQCHRDPQSPQHYRCRFLSSSLEPA